MNDAVKCFEVVSSVVEEGTSQFAPLWKINDENFRILETYCEVFDSLASEFGGVAFEVEVDDIKMTVGISLICEELIILSQSHNFYRLVQKSNSFDFSTSEEYLVARFEFPSVWEKE